MTSHKASRDVKIVNPKGLHARPAAALSRLASQYDAEVWLHCDGQDANARSIMDLLMLIAQSGSAIEVRAEGAAAEDAVIAIAALIEAGFGEID
ncbi:MAG: HPr family phosphocarrier protein [Pseudomonadota bacterium]